MTLLTVRRDGGAATAPAISVVIPTLQGGARLGGLLDAVAGQHVRAGSVEVLIADSGSSDGSIERALRAHPALRLFDVPRGRFDHGLVRAALVEQARAPLIALFSQDAIPLGSDYLETLAAPFALPEVAGAMARQIARVGADPLQQAELERWTPYDPRPHLIRRLPPGAGSLPPAERLRLARFDNVGSMVRRSHALALPFPSRPFGEDLAWGWAQLCAGRALAYVPGAQVEHSHRPSVRGAFDRHRIAHRQASAEFGLCAVPSLPAAALALIRGTPGDLRDGGPVWALRGLPRRGAALLGQWLGARDVRP